MFYMMTDHLSEAYKSIYQRKDLTSPPKDAEGMTGKMNPQAKVRVQSARGPICQENFPEM